MTFSSHLAGILSKRRKTSAEASHCEGKKEGVSMALAIMGLSRPPLGGSWPAVPLAHTLTTVAKEAHLS